MKKFLILAPDGVEFEVVRVTSDMQSILVMETPTSVSRIDLHEEHQDEVKEQPVTSSTAYSAPEDTIDTDNSSANVSYNTAESDLL